MKEKVVVVNTNGTIIQRNVREVEELLEQGWTVKSVTMDHCGDFSTAIFVLQKE